MANLVAIVYPDQHRAAEVMATSRRLQSEYLIDLEDACVVIKDEAGKLQLHQSVNLTATGALAGRLSDYGIDDDFIKSLAAEMQPSSSAIFALVRRATVDKVEPEVAKFGGKLLHTSLSKEAEAKFQAMLDEANKSA
jgi:uncharacterized membrane protein